MPIVVKNEENHQNKSSQSNHSKDVELVINVSKNHRVKRGHGISDSLPGIRKNRYGYVLVNSFFCRDYLSKRGSRPIDFSKIKSEELRELLVSLL